MIWNSVSSTSTRSLQWRHKKRDSVLNHQPHDCLLNIITLVRIKKPGSTPKCMVQHKKARFDTKMHGSTRKCPPQPASVDIGIINTHTPNSEVELQIEFKSFTAARLDI